jgi:Spy/CpxP family protein refolding chaperone
MNMKKSLSALLSLGLLAALIQTAVGQPGRGGFPGGGRGGFPGGGPGFGGGGPGGLQGQTDGMTGLDEQQQQLFQQNLQKSADKLRGLEERLRAAQQELLQATLAATFDEKVVQGKAEAVAATQVEMTMLRAKALATVAQTMPPDERQQFADSPGAATLLSGGNPGRGPGGGPAGGFAGGGPGAFGGGPGGFGGGQGFAGGGMAGPGDPQGQLLQQALQKESGTLRNLEAKLRVAQQELLQATVAPSYDEKTVQGKAEAVGAIQVQMTMVRAKALAAVAQTMTPEARQQMVSSPSASQLLSGGTANTGGGARGIPGNGRGGGFPGGGRGDFPGGGGATTPKER